MGAFFLSYRCGNSFGHSVASYLGQGKFQKQGKSKVDKYYGAYAAAKRWAFSAGIVDGRPAMIRL
jgi:hypothetical protein